MSGYVSRKLRDRSGATARRTTRREPEDPAPAARSAKSGGGKQAEESKSAKSSSTATKTAERPSAKPKPKRPSPRPAPGRRPSPAARRIDQAAKRKKRSRSLTLDWNQIVRRLAPIAAVMVILAGVAFWGSWASSGTPTSSERLNDATGSAKAAAAALFSYDYRHFDDSVKNGEAHAVGKYAKSYVDTTKGLESQVKKLRARVTAEVVDVGVIEDDTTCATKGGKEYSDGVRVLAFVEQYTRNDNIDGTKDSSSRVELCMVQVNDAWKAADAKAK